MSFFMTCLASGFLASGLSVSATLLANSILLSQPSENTTTPPAAAIRICLAGDSTVAPKSGWGAGFQQLLNDRAECINLAKGGRSSRSFRAEGHWQKCLDSKPDVILIQFGHNDQPGKGPERESAADGAFRDHLRQYVTEARAAGIRPVLVTSLTRRRWKPDGTIEATLQEYATATAIVAAELQVPLLDLHRLSIQQCEQLGPELYRAFEPMTEKGADHTHLNAEGSVAAGQLVAKELIALLPELATVFSEERLSAAAVPAIYRRHLTAGTLQLIDDDAVLRIEQSGRSVLVYNKVSPPVPDGMDPRYQRSGFLHPVASPSGRVVTAAFPVDHPHQHGIFTAWVQTTWNDRTIDFWNLAGGTGRVLHQRIRTTFDDGKTVGFEADLIHRAEQDPVVDILREHWKITAIPTDGTYHAFDLESTQQAISDLPLVIKKYHYGGMALRGPVQWLTPKDGDRSTSSEGRNGSEFLNDLGSDRLKGNHEHAKWVSLTGSIDGSVVSITVLGHQDNFRSPQAARIHPTKPYFTFAPCVDDEFIIDREHPYHSRYRYLITDAAPDSVWLNEQWALWNQR
jgi:lysophospholipase L1-like esterase